MARPRWLKWLDWRAGLGLALGVALLYFALRDVDPAQVIAGWRAAEPWPFLIGVALATFVFAVRAARWRPLIRPVRPDSAFRPRFAATTIGFMANNLLPARVGEFARAYALGRLERVPVAASFGSLVVERLLDGFTVVGFLFLSMAAPSFPDRARLGGRDPTAIGIIFLAVFAAAAIVLLAMVLWPEGTRRLFEGTLGRVLPESLGRPLVDALKSLTSGLAPLRRPGLLIQAVLWSLAVWLINSASFWFAFRAFDMDVPFAGAMFLQSLIALAVALPAAPGFFGLYEAAARIGLVTVWSVPLNRAMSFAIGFHAATFVPVTLIGLYYAWRLGITLREMEASEETTERAVEAAQPSEPGGGPWK